MTKASTRPATADANRTVPADELERIAALRALDILDSAEEDIYDVIVQAAADVCQTPMAALTFIDQDRQWFKARVGIEGRETARGVSFCSHTIQGSDVLVIPDTWKDARFRENPCVICAPYMRFYAGAPLRTESGVAVGALCVSDTAPRRLTTQQKDTLSALAESAMRMLRLRKNLGASVFARAVDLTSDGVTVADLSRGSVNILYANESFLQLTGYKYGETINQHPAFPLRIEEPEVRQAFDEAMLGEHMTTMEGHFRRHDGQLCWLRSSFVPYLGSGGGVKYLVTVHRDVTALRESDAQAQQLHAMRTTMASVSHVIRNFLNSAQLFAQQASQVGVDPALKTSFLASLEDTRARLAAIDRMEKYRDRLTPFGFRVLDTEEKD